MVANNQNIILHSEADLASFAETFAKEISFGITIGLIGELGAGKTTFVKYFLNALGSADEVSSPSYVLEHAYSCTKGTVEHWDVYRIQAAPMELSAPPDKSTLRIIEWADKLFDDPAIHPLDVLFRFEVVSDTERVIRITKA